MVVLIYPDKIDKIAVGCILIYNGKFLLTHRAKDGKWGSVAGEVEDEESPDAAIRREIMEELSLHIEPEFFTTVHHDYGGEIVEYNLFMHVFENDPSEEIGLDSSSKGFEFFDLEGALDLELFEDEDYCLKLYKESFSEDEEF
jgi:8-oxo-dGTP pyrophosphatase MutT (NUDIX family)